MPPGQYWVSEFPALPAGPPPAVTKADWAFSLTTEDGLTRRWDWPAFRALPSQRISEAAGYFVMLARPKENSWT